MNFINFMDLDVNITHAHCFQAPWQWHCFGCVKGSRKVVSTVFLETNLTTPCCYAICTFNLRTIVTSCVAVCLAQSCKKEIKLVAQMREYALA